MCLRIPKSSARSQTNCSQRPRHKARRRRRRARPLVERARLKAIERFLEVRYPAVQVGSKHRQEVERRLEAFLVFISDHLVHFGLFE